MLAKFFALLFMLVLVLAVSAEKGDHERFVRSGSHEGGWGRRRWGGGKLFRSGNLKLKV
jgi:hypothetical protein